MAREEYIRSGVGIINTNVDAYHKAKARKKREDRLQSLETRINKLEMTIKVLERTVNGCKRDSS